MRRPQKRSRAVCRHVSGSISPARSMAWAICGTSVTNTSNLNFVSGQTIANTVVVTIGAQGDICLYISATTHLVIDLDNAYAPTS